MKDTDRQIQEAIETGQANKRTLELVQNWCSHVTTERFGGVGLVEIQTGLPIGMLGLSCPHASHRGMAAWDLERAALDFYDQNCVGCTKRRPVRLPNFSEVVAERDRRHAQARDRAEQELDAGRMAVEMRVANRAQLAAGSEATKRGILQRIDELDTDPTPEKAALLCENARTFPEKFDAGVQDAVEALLGVGGLRAGTALEVLSLVAKGTQRLEDAALRMLATGEHHALAGQLIAGRLRAASPSEVRAALPAVARLAAPFRDIGAFASSSTPEPFLDAWAASSPEVRAYIEHLSCSDHKHSRILACRCASLLVQQDPGLAPEFVDQALRSVDKPDDEYAPEGAASSAVSELLASALMVSFDEMDGFLQLKAANGSEEQRAAIVRSYVRVLRSLEERPGATPSFIETAFRRVLDVIAARRLDGIFGEAIDFMGYASYHYLACAGRNVETLVGVAALLLEDAADRYSPLLDPRPTMIKALEADSRRMRLLSAAERILDLVGRAGAASPRSTGVLIVSMLDSIGEGKDALRAALVKCLGDIAQSRDGLAVAIPAIYGGMMAPQQLVRAAAASAYGEIADGAEDLPRLMHEAFLLLLGDPFVVVHGAAVRALQRVHLPRDLEEQAMVLAWHVARAHAGGEDGRLVEEGIAAVLGLAKGELTDRFKSMVLTMVSGLNAASAAELLLRNGRTLSGVPEYADALVKVLSSDDLSDDRRKKVLKRLTDFSRADIDRCGADIVGIATRVHPRAGWEIERLLAAAARVDAWELCEAIARAPLEKLADVPRDRELRLIATVRRIAVEIEGNLSRGMGAAIPGLVQSWRAVLTEIEAVRPDLLKEWVLLRSFAVRVDALEAVRAIAQGTSTADSAGEVAKSLSSRAGAIGGVDTGRAFVAHSQLVAALGQLGRWAAAVRSAEVDADRFLRAARQASKDIRTTLGAAPATLWRAGVANALDQLDALVDIEGIAAVAAAVASVAMPLPFAEQQGPSGFAQPVRGEQAPDPCVVFVSFSVDSVPLADPHVVTPNELHDLDLSVRVSRWPAGAELILDALTVEPTPTVAELPRFTLTCPTGSGPHDVRHGGRMLIKVAQAIAARPLEFVYRAYFLPEQPQLRVVVEGERRIRVRCHDPYRNPVTGYSQVDLRLIELRDELRSFVGLRDRDMDAFLLVLAGLGQLAGEALQDSTFPGKTREGEFQRKTREHLRKHPQIGSELQEHAHAAGGITDLSFRGIPIELKVEADALVVPDNVEGYSQQTAQYTTGSDKRLGILCVLDCSEKSEAPGSIVNDIVLLPLPPPGQARGLPLLLGVVIIRGNLARPSDLSR